MDLDALDARPLRGGVWAVVALGASVWSGCFSAEPHCDIPEQVTDPELRVLSYNVGNSDDGDPDYPLRMSESSYEAFVAQRIRSLDADVVALQEVLPPRTCERFTERDPGRTCFEPETRPPAVRRLLGPDYSVVCDAQLNVDCLGIHTRLGPIRGLELGGLRVDGAETPALPLPPCDGIDGECEGNARTCDVESSVSAVTVDTARGPLRVVHLHPTAIGNECRQRQLDQAFDLAGDGPALMLGDWNFDPDRVVFVVETGIWSRHVGRRFRDHGERDPETCARRRTSVSRPVAIDHVVSDFGEGACRVHRDPPLDEGFDFTTLASDGDYDRRIDHFAVECPLRWSTRR